jgi:hypothetical protein
MELNFKQPQGSKHVEIHFEQLLNRDRGVHDITPFQSLREIFQGRSIQGE